MYVPSSVITELDLNTGDAIKIKRVNEASDYSDEEVTYAGDEAIFEDPPLTKGFIYFVGNIGSAENVTETIQLFNSGETKDYAYTSVKKVYLYRRRDRRLEMKSGSELAYNLFADLFSDLRSKEIKQVTGDKLMNNPMNISRAWGKFAIEKIHS